jgi:hypothetical protein
MYINMYDIEHMQDTCDLGHQVFIHNDFSVHAYMRAYM